MSVELRRATLEDAGQLYYWRVANNKWFFGECPTSVDHARWLENACQDESQRVFVILTPEPVGTISLYNVDEIHRRAEYGRFIIDEAERGKGLGRAALELALHYAFAALYVNRVYADILYDNRAGLAVAHSCGFHTEGIFPEYICKDGIYRDAVRVAILRDKWFRKRIAG